MKKIHFLLFIAYLLLWSQPVFALEPPKTALKTFHISQEQFALDGVLVSRPKSLDLKILDIISLYKIHSLEDYAYWLKNNIKYYKDGSVDYWANAKETLEKRRGDCEDYTFLNISVLKLFGYQPRFIALQRPGFAHAICVFKENGYYFWFDNAKLIKTKTKSMEELARYLMTTYKYNQFLEYNLSNNHWNVLYNKS